MNCPEKSEMKAATAIKKKVLIVNCYFPDERQAVKRSHQVPNAVAPVLLAGYLDSERCDIKLYNEVSSGFIEVYQPELLQWPDMIILSGLTAAFDRFLHLTAYTRTANENVVVVAGGHAIRSLPTYSQNFFDYCCVNDVEEIAEVVTEVFGEQYVAQEFNPRYDLAYWIDRLGYAESTRNCNFQCGFCSLTAAGRKYEIAPDSYLEAQMANMGKRLIFFFEDNQVFGAGFEDLKRRLNLFQRRRKAGQFRYWSGFVTDTFFWDEKNISLAQSTGCISVFVGVESFDDHQWLAGANKKQNSRFRQKDLLMRALDGGILVQYGLVFDPTQQTVADIQRELDIICADPEIPSPNFIFTATPYPGTPFFRECVEKGLLLPNTNVRDLEGSTLCLKTKEEQSKVVDFIRDGRRLLNHRRRLIIHQYKFQKRYRKSLNIHQRILAAITTLAIIAPTFILGPASIFRRKMPRTHVSTTELLDEVYTPMLPVKLCYQDHFKPTQVTDAEGNINQELAVDLLQEQQRFSPNSDFIVIKKIA